MEIVKNGPNDLFHVAWAFSAFFSPFLFLKINKCFFHRIEVPRPPTTTLPPPSLQTRVGGGVLNHSNHYHHPAPSLAPNASRRGGFEPFQPLPPPCPLLRPKCELEGFFLNLSNHYHHLSPSLAPNPSRRGHF
jgi:hypothetical protein